MKKVRFFAVIFSLVLAGSPAWADCCMMHMGMGTGPSMLGGTEMGPGMMDGSGMMRHPMMGMGMGMGMGRSMMDQSMMGMGMGRGRQACVMQNCWHDGMGSVLPHMTIQNAFREISGYQANAAALGLNEDQLQRLMDLRENLTASMIRIHADLQISAIDFRRAMARENPEVSTAEKIIDRNSEMLNKLQKATVKAVAEARNILTAQQRRQARELAAAAPMMMPVPDGPEAGAPAPNREQHH